MQICVKNASCQKIATLYLQEILNTFKLPSAFQSTAYPLKCTEELLRRCTSLTSKQTLFHPHEPMNQVQIAIWISSRKIRHIGKSNYALNWKEGTRLLKMEKQKKTRLENKTNRYSMFCSEILFKFTAQHTCQSGENVGENRVSKFTCKKVLSSMRFLNLKIWKKLKNLKSMQKILIF